MYNGGGENMDFPYIIAHRGASKAAPENTMAAFHKAVKQGATWIELDVHLTKDQEIVVIHDEKVDRTTNGEGWVKDLTLKELKKLDAGKWFSKKFKGERIPTLKEVIEFAKQKNIYLNIELKNAIIQYEELEEKVIQLIQLYDFVEKVIISSFNHFGLQKVKKINSSVKTGILYAIGFVEPWEYAKKLGADAIHPIFYSINTEMVSEAKQRGLLVHPYTVDRKEDLLAMIEAQVDGIITNVPDQLIEIYKNKKINN